MQKRHGSRRKTDVLYPFHTRKTETPIIKPQPSMTTHPPFFSPSARCTAPSPCCTCPRRTSRRPSRKMPPWKPLRVFLGGMRWRREARYPRPKLQLQRRGGAGTQLAEAARAAGPGKPDYYENRSAAPGLGEMQEAPQAWAPVTRALNPRSRRLKS